MDLVLSVNEFKVSLHLVKHSGLLSADGLIKLSNSHLPVAVCQPQVFVIDAVLEEDHGEIEKDQLTQHSPHTLASDEPVPICQLALSVMHLFNQVAVLDSDIADCQVVNWEVVEIRFEVQAPLDCLPVDDVQDLHCNRRNTTNCEVQDSDEYTGLGVVFEEE